MSDTGGRIPYVQSVGSLDVPPPYHFPGVTVNTFIWEAQMAPIQAYCDTFFNIGSAQERGFVYKPAPFWPYATLLFLDYPVMISSNPAPQDMGEVPYADRGIISQTEVFVAIPVVRYGVGGAAAVTRTEFEWILPFIAVGNPMSAVCGREMLGLGKLLARIGTGESAFPDSFRGTMDLPGWADTKPGTKQEELRFLTVDTGPALPTFRASDPRRSLATLLQSREAGWLLDGMAALGNLVDEASLGLFPTTMRTVGLKQYRDALHTEQAVYQALVSCRARYTNIRQVRMYDEQDVTIEVNRAGSFRDIVDLILDTASLPPGVPIKAKPIAAYRFMADIDYDSMQVSYEYPIVGTAGLADRPARADLDARWFRPLKGFFGPERRP